MKKKKLDFGYACLLALLAFFPAWIYFRFPVYNEQKITRIVERNIPIGTSQTDTIKFLNSFKSKGVIGEKFDGVFLAYFPDDFPGVFFGTSYIVVYFQFKNDKLNTFKMERINM